MRSNIIRLLSAVVVFTFAILACGGGSSGPPSGPEAARERESETAFYLPFAQTEAVQATQKAASLNITATEIYAQGTALAARYTAEASSTTPVPVPIPVSGAPALVNPGFEDGILGWTDVNSTCGSKSDADNGEAHSGAQSRKLYLRFCGSVIYQRASGSLPQGSSATLKAWVKMPFPGDQANKWFRLSLILGGADSSQTAQAFVDQFDALPDWTQLTVGPLVADFPVTWIEVMAQSDKGGGADQAYDKPVWVDDFELVTQTP
jgi:hypothetical protein